MGKSKSPRPAQAPASEPSLENENKPAHTIRYGAIKATIWRNDGEKGIFHNVTLSRSWRDDDGKWHDTTSFNFKDLPHLAKAITDSHSWIAWQERKLAEEAKVTGR